jgi:uncharacterized membrane protein YphA (DoxX/SURF4 family)
MKTLLFLSRIFAGLVFVFSGFVKAIDPMGFAIKFEEYFIAFHLDFLIFTAIPLAIFISAAEFMIGLNLLAGIRLRITAVLLMIFMSFFTVLTFILALTNPVSDCGCFGDAIKLTNWQTFYKNMILLIPTLFIFINREKTGRFATPSWEWTLAGMNFLLAAAISLFCIRYQPLLDFRPYRTGFSIPEKMATPEGAPADIYETVLVYQKNGVRQEFSESNFPWQDTTWKWVETRQTLIKKGYEPPIHDFSITTEEGLDITENILRDSSYTFLIIAPFLENSSVKGMERMNRLALKASELGFSVFCLTASPGKQIATFKEKFQPDFPFCTTDETTLKTIIRANPGLLVLREGTILGKWNHADVPDPGKIKANLLSYLISRHTATKESSTVVILAMVVILFYTMLVIVRRPQEKL